MNDHYTYDYDPGPDCTTSLRLEPAEVEIIDSALMLFAKTQAEQGNSGAAIDVVRLLDKVRGDE